MENWKEVMLKQHEIDILVNKLLRFEADIYEKNYDLVDFSVDDLYEITNNMD